MGKLVILKNNRLEIKIQIVSYTRKSIGDMLLVLILRAKT